MSSEQIDCYNVLGIHRKAPFEEIRKAYRQLALKYHPDKNPGDKEAEEKFKKAATAWEILGNKEKKAAYDVWLQIPNDLQNDQHFSSFIDVLMNGFPDDFYISPEKRHSNALSHLAADGEKYSPGDPLWLLLEEIYKIKRCKIHTPMTGVNLKEACDRALGMVEAEPDLIHRVNLAQVELKFAPDPNVGKLFDIWINDSETKLPPYILYQFMHEAAHAYDEPEKRKRLAKDAINIIKKNPEAVFELESQSLGSITLERDDPNIRDMLMTVWRTIKTLEKPTPADDFRLSPEPRKGFFADLGK